MCGIRLRFCAHGKRGLHSYGFITCCSYYTYRFTNPMLWRHSMQTCRNMSTTIRASICPSVVECAYDISNNISQSDTATRSKSWANRWLWHAQQTTDAHTLNSFDCLCSRTECLCACTNNRATVSNTKRFLVVFLSAARIPKSIRRRGHVFCAVFSKCIHFT